MASFTKRLLALSLSVFLAGCTASQSRTPLPVAISPAPAEINPVVDSLVLPALSPTDYHTGPRDVLEITLFNIPEENGLVPRTGEVRVNQEGMISLPLLGEIPVVGLTVSALEQKLGKRYEEYMYNPQVRVIVKEYNSQRVLIAGSVRNPGQFKLSSSMTLVDVLALAGGVSPDVGGQVHLYRQGPEGRQSYILDLHAVIENVGAANLPVQDGDVINIPKAGAFFVDGAVGRPGSYPLSQPYTLTQALVVAGGVEQTPAKYDGITIFRPQGYGQFEKIAVDLNGIRTGETADLLVQANDVILVPTSMTKQIVNRFLGILSIGVSAPVGGAGIFGGAGR